MYWQTCLQSVRTRIATGLPVNVSFETQDDEHKTLYSFESLERLHLPPKPTDWFFDARLFRNEAEIDTYDTFEERLEQLQTANPYYAAFRYLKTLRGHSRSVYSIAFSPNGQILASSSADTTIKLWNLYSRQEICTLRGHVNSVLSVAISPDGQTLVSGSADARIKLWNLHTRQEICRLHGHTHSVNSVAISPDGQILATGSADATIKLWNLNNGQEIATFRGHTNSVLCVAISPDGQILASGSTDATIKLWNLQKQLEISCLGQDLGYVYALCFWPHHEIIASATGNKIILKHLKTLNAVDIVPGYTSIAASPDGQILVAGGPIIRMWDLTKNQVIRLFPQKSESDSLPYHEDYVYAVAFGPDGQVFASASRDTTIKLWGIPQPLNF